jgi:uncharacterized iron-regulated membrane protein
MGWWNFALAVIACLFLIVLSVSGIVIWWLRKPASASVLSYFSTKISAPISEISVHQAVISKSEKVLILFCCLVAFIFPVTGIAMLLFSLIEWVGRNKSTDKKL